MVRVMAWRRAGDKPLPQPGVAHLLTCRFIHNRPLMRLMTYIGNIDSNWGWNRNMPYNQNKNVVPQFHDPFYPISPAVDTTWFAHEGEMCGAFCEECGCIWELHNLEWLILLHFYVIFHLILPIMIQLTNRHVSGNGLVTSRGQAVASINDTCSGVCGCVYMYVYVYG